MSKQRQQQAKTIRIVRKIHRWTGLSLLLVFVLISITGILLAWKKNSNGYLLPSSQKGISVDAKDWLPLEQLSQRAIWVLDSLDASLDPTIDRMDVRPSKGMVKVTFEGHYQEIQLDCSTGQVLSVASRRSDFLEELHDGSLFDAYLGTSFIKLLYSSVSGIALLLFTVTGFWLWYGPRRMRKRS